MTPPVSPRRPPALVTHPESRLVPRQPRPCLRGLSLGLLVLLFGSFLTVTAAAPARAQAYVPISGAGSTWSQNAVDQWRRNVNQYGLKVNYAGSGSSDGRNQFRNGTVDFAVSEIPYGLSDSGVVDAPPQRSSAYMPIVAGGTSFMYNLKIGGRRVTNLRLSGETIARIFTGQITRWDDPAVKADNPGLALPARRVVPVVRSDGSGTTAQFSSFLSKRYGALWDSWCGRAGRRTPCGVTSNYPVVPGSGFVAQSGSLGVSTYVGQAQSEGAITYVEYSYAINAGFPVAKVLNAKGFYVEPTASNVAVGLLKARINTDPASPSYLTSILDEVYVNPDPRAYPLSSYSYMILPTKAEGTFNTAKGKSLGDFAYYFLCEGQQQAPALGFSPLPINLVRAGLDQVRKIPGIDARAVDITKCNNPTFSPSGVNLLARNAPPPPACDQRGTTQCTTGTGGARTPTATSATSATTAGSAVAVARPDSRPAAAGPARRAADPAAAPRAAGAAAAATAGAIAAPTAVSGAAVPAAARGVTAAAPLGAGTGVAAVDPDGVAPVVADSQGQAVLAVPTSLDQSGSTATTAALALLCVALLIGLTVVPPLASRWIGRKADGGTP